MEKQNKRNDKKDNSGKPNAPTNKAFYDVCKEGDKCTVCIKKANKKKY